MDNEDLKQKVATLKALGTKDLTTKLHEAENFLEKALHEEASFKNLNLEYLSSGTNDCQAVKQRLAEVAVMAPENMEVERPLTETEKKAWVKERDKQDPTTSPRTIADAPEKTTVAKSLTEAEKKAWLERQRKEDTELFAAIDKQKQVAFLLDGSQIQTEMAKRRLDGIRAVLALRTQQIAFLAA